MLAISNLSTRSVEISLYVNLEDIACAAGNANTCELSKQKYVMRLHVNGWHHRCINLSVAASYTAEACDAPANVAHSRAVLLTLLKNVIAHYAPPIPCTRHFHVSNNSSGERFKNNLSLVIVKYWPRLIIDSVPSNTRADKTFVLYFHGLLLRVSQRSMHRSRIRIVDNLSDVSVIFVETDNSRSRAKARGIREYIAYVDTREQIKRWINKCVWLVRVQFFKRPALPWASHCYSTGRVLFVNRTRWIYHSDFNSTPMFTFANIYNAYQILPYVIFSGYIRFHRPRNRRIMYSVSLLQCHGLSM